MENGNFIKGKGVVTYFNFRRMFKDNKGRTRTGGQGFIHKAGCSKQCRDKTHTVGYFTWEQAWDGGLERKNMIGAEVTFTAYPPRKEGQAPYVRSMRAVDPRFAA